MTLPTPPKLKRSLKSVAQIGDKQSRDKLTSLELDTSLKHDSLQGINIQVGVPKSSVIQIDQGQEEYHMTPVLSQKRVYLQERELSDNAQCTCCPHMKQYMKEILTQQHLTQTVLNEVLDRQNSSAQVMEELTRSETIFQGFRLPIKTVEKFNNLDAFLENESIFKKGVTELAKIGGRSNYEFIKRCLTMIITNDLALEYSWLGRRTKKKFSTTNLAKLLVAAADEAKRSNSLKESEESIGHWLRRAKERLANKNK